MFSLPTGEDMRLYGHDRHTEERAMFLRLADKRREHTHTPLRSQAVCRSRQQFSIWRSTGIELGGAALQGVSSPQRQPRGAAVLWRVRSAYPRCGVHRTCGICSNRCCVPTTGSLASTGLGTAGAERGHQIRKEFRILAAAKDQLGKQQSIIG